MPSSYQSIVIERPLAVVWGVLRNFHDLGWAIGVIDDWRIVGDRTAGQIGARRSINGVFFEELLELSDLTHTLKYQIYDGPSPLSPQEVSRFIAVAAIKPVTETDAAFVEWSARWNGNDPGDVTRNFASEIFTELLRRLRSHCESAG
jgi:hypothetical protein